MSAKKTEEYLSKAVELIDLAEMRGGAMTDRERATSDTCSTTPRRCTSSSASATCSEARPAVDAYLFAPV